MAGGVQHDPVTQQVTVVGCDDASIAPQSIAHATPASKSSTHQSRCHCVVGWPGWAGHTGRWWCSCYCISIPWSARL
jgi:hypothetical protein